MAANKTYPTTCIVCGKDMIARRGAKYCSHECAGQSPTLCACSRPAVRRFDGDWCCQKCIDLETYRRTRLKRTAGVEEEPVIEYGWVRQYLRIEALNGRKLAKNQLLKESFL